MKSSLTRRSFIGTTIAAMACHGVAGCSREGTNMNDPRKDIYRKLQVQPEWFLVGVLDERIIASVMAGFDGQLTRTN